MRPAATTGVLLLLGLAWLPAQSNQMIDALLAEPLATAGRTAHLVLSAASLVEDDASAEEAFEALGGQGWELTLGTADSPVRLGEYAYMVMRALEIPGGVMYGLAPGPRYACRELAFLGLIPGRPHAYRTLSGEEALEILSRVLAWRESRS